MTGGLSVDYTITIGNMIEIVSIVGGGLLVLWTLKGDVTALKEGAAAMQTEITKIADIMTKVAVQSERLNSMSDRLALLDRRYDEIRHGDGFVQGRKGVDREY